MTNNFFNCTIICTFFIYCATDFFLTPVMLGYVITHLLAISALTDVLSLHCTLLEIKNFLFVYLH